MASRLIINPLRARGPEAEDVPLPIADAALTAAAAPGNTDTIDALLKQHSQSSRDRNRS